MTGRIPVLFRNRVERGTLSSRRPHKYVYLWKKVRERSLIFWAVWYTQQCN